MMKNLAFFILFSSVIIAQEETNQPATKSQSINYWSASSSNIHNTNSRYVGIHKTTPMTQLHIGGTGGFLVEGEFDSGPELFLEAGTRMHWYPRRGAFRVGYVDTLEKDDAKTGKYSFASGYSTKASGTVSTAMGSLTTASGPFSTAMGLETIANGWASTAFGCRTTASVSNSTAMGFACHADKSGSFVIGDGSTVTVMKAKYENIIKMRFSGGYTFYTNSSCNSGVYLSPGGWSWLIVSDSTKKENYLPADGEYFLNGISKLKLGSWNYKIQEREHRHYGPMSQEIFRHFGKDQYGTIGNDSTLATADMDGIMMIAIKALEKRTAELKKQNTEVRRQYSEVSSKNEDLLARVAKLEKMFELLAVEKQAERRTEVAKK